MKKLLLLIMLIPINTFALEVNNIIVDGKTVELKDNIYNYEMELYTINNSADIVVDVNENVKYEIIGNENLTIGSNLVTINLNNETESISYYLNLIKQEVNVITLSNNNKLKNLSISGYPLGFDSEKLEYNLTIGSESKLNLSCEAESDEAEVYVYGNEELVNGSIIKIKVVAQSGDVREYKINITATEVREEMEIYDPEKTDYKIIAYLVAASLISIFLIIINISGKK